MYTSSKMYAIFLTWHMVGIKLIFMLRQTFFLEL